MNKTIKRELEIVIKGVKYTASFPTVGDFLNIERYKMTLSASQYSAMVASGLFSAGQALDIIDMIAYFTVLIPKLKEDLKVETFSELDLLDSKELVDLYKGEFKPWVEEWMKLFSEPSVKKTKKEE